VNEGTIEQGTIEQGDGMVTCRFERLLRHPVEVVWRAITEPDEIERWMGTRPDIDLRPGGQYVTRHRTGDEVTDHITRLEPPRLLEHTFWEHVNPSARVTWELSPAGDGSRLVLTHRLSLDDVRRAAATVAAGDDIFTIISRNCAGWHRLLDMLAATLDGRSRPWSDQDQKALQDRYAAMLEAEQS
jgi:uncharacterized protein YndB with AHSA1/START domain